MFELSKHRQIQILGKKLEHVINVKILPYARIVEKTSVYLECVSWSFSYVDRSVTTVEYVRIVYRSRLLDWIKSRCYIERYSPLDLFEPESGIIRIPQQPLSDFFLGQL